MHCLDIQFIQIWVLLFLLLHDLPFLSSKRAILNPLSNVFDPPPYHLGILDLLSILLPLSIRNASIGSVVRIPHFFDNIAHDIFGIVCVIFGFALCQNPIDADGVTVIENPYAGEIFEYDKDGCASAVEVVKYLDLIY